MKIGFDERFLFKTATWINNDQIPPQHRIKLLTHIWKPNLIPKIKFFARKLIRGRIPTRKNLGKINLKVNAYYPFRINHLEYIDHLLIQYSSVVRSGLQELNIVIFLSMAIFIS